MKIKFLTLLFSALVFTAFTAPSFACPGMKNCHCAGEMHCAKCKSGKKCGCHVTQNKDTKHTVKLHTKTVHHAAHHA